MPISVFCFLDFGNERGHTGTLRIGANGVVGLLTRQLRLHLRPPRPSTILIAPASDLHGHRPYHPRSAPRTRRRRVLNVNEYD
jgi:hypothetical protein